MAGDTFVYRVCQTARDGDGGKVKESLELESWVCLDSIKIFLGNMLNRSGGATSVSLARVHCTGRKLRELSVILTNKEGSLKSESACGTCDMCVECNDVCQ